LLFLLAKHEAHLASTPVERLVRFIIRELVAVAVTVSALGLSVVGSVVVVLLFSRHLGFWDAVEEARKGQVKGWRTSDCEISDSLFDLLFVLSILWLDSPREPSCLSGNQNTEPAVESHSSSPL